MPGTEVYTAIISNSTDNSVGLPSETENTEKSRHVVCKEILLPMGKLSACASEFIQKLCSDLQNYNECLDTANQDSEYPDRKQLEFVMASINMIATNLDLVSSVPIGTNSPDNRPNFQLGDRETDEKHNVAIDVALIIYVNLMNYAYANVDADDVSQSSQQAQMQLVYSINEMVHAIMSSSPMTTESDGFPTVRVQENGDDKSITFRYNNLTNRMFISLEKIKEIIDSKIPNEMFTNGNDKPSTTPEKVGSLYSHLKYLYKEGIYPFNVAEIIANMAKTVSRSTQAGVVVTDQKLENWVVRNGRVYQIDLEGAVPIGAPIATIHNLMYALTESFAYPHYYIQEAYALMIFEILLGRPIFDPDNEKRVTSEEMKDIFKDTINNNANILPIASMSHEDISTLKNLLKRAISENEKKFSDSSILLSAVALLLNKDSYDQNTEDGKEAKVLVEKYLELLGNNAENDKMNNIDSDFDLMNLLISVSQNEILKSDFMRLFAINEDTDQIEFIETIYRRIAHRPELLRLYQQRKNSAESEIAA